MSIGADLIVSLASVIASFLLTCIVGVFVWYFKKYVISEIEKNAEHRRRAEGEHPHKDMGKLDHIEEHLGEMEQERKEEHEEVRQKLEFVTEYVRRIASAINREVDGAEVADPESGEADFTRGGSSGDD